MQIHTDRFETTLPKGRFFTPSPKKPQKKTGLMIASALAVGLVLGIILPVITNRDVSPNVEKVARPAPPLDATTPAPTPAHRLPMPAPAQPLDAPHAQLVHVRPIGSIMRVQMPDGRVLETRYMGELPSPLHLPRTGGQLGDEWYTRTDNHCWVLGNLPGSVSTGWIDP
jgi:hypothetical protein